MAYAQYSGVSELMFSFLMLPIRQSRDSTSDKSQEVQHTKLMKEISLASTQNYASDNINDSSACWTLGFDLPACSPSSRSIFHIFLLHLNICRPVKAAIRGNLVHAFIEVAHPHMEKSCGV
jgi:hypothetical protein